MPRYKRAFKRWLVKRLLRAEAADVAALERNFSVPARTLERWRADALIARGIHKAPGLNRATQDSLSFHCGSVRGRVS